MASPKCEFYKSESGYKFGAEYSFPHWKVEEQPERKPKNSGNGERCRTVGLRISGKRAAEIFSDFTEELTSLGINSTIAIHKSCAASCKLGPSIGKIEV